MFVHCPLSFLNASDQKEDRQGDPLYLYLQQGLINRL